MKIALLGLDSFYFTNALSGALRASPEFELTACCDLGATPEETLANAGYRPDELALAAGAPLFHDVRELFAALKVEGVCIATRPSRIPAALRQIPDHVHTYLVKPAAANRRDLQHLSRLLAKRAGVVVSGLTGRLNPVLREARARVATGAIGQLVSVRVSHQHGRLSDWPRESWYFDPDTAPPAVTLGWYCMDLLAWFTGSRPHDLSGRAGRLTDLDSPHPDFIKAVGRMQSGTLFSIDILFSVSWPYPSFEIEAIGQSGALRVTQPTPAGWQFTAGGPLGFSAAPADELRVELEQWGRACRREEAPFIQTQEILANLQDCLLLQETISSEQL
jgi:predicted dehydrogenase